MLVIIKLFFKVTFFLINLKSKVQNRVYIKLKIVESKILKIRNVKILKTFFFFNMESLKIIIYLFIL